MSKFCGKCGAKIDEATGLCPNCDADKLKRDVKQEERAHPEADVTSFPKSAQSKKELRKRNKVEKRAVKRAAKKAEKNGWSLGKRIRRFVLKLVLSLLLIAVLASCCLGALVYFDVIDIPVIEDLLNVVGLKSMYPKNVEFDENNIGELFFHQTEEEHIATNSDGVKYVDNEILLVASDTATYDDIKNLAKQYNAEIVGWIEQTGDYQLKLAEVYHEEELNDIIISLENDNRVISAYVDYVFVLSDERTTERDGFIYGNEWEKDLQNFNNCKGKSWGLEAIEALAAWDILNSHSSQVNPVRIGLVDTGFDIDHEDLGFAETFYNTVSDHGTHVAGTMAAKSNNQEGICGVYPYGDGNLYGVSYSGVCNYSENGTPFATSMFLKIAYSELILRNVKVINSSLGFNYKQWPLSYSDPEWSAQVDFLESNAYILGDFLNRLLEKGYDYVLITSAGNDSNRKNNIIYDSRYNFWTTVISRDDYPDVYDRIVVVGAVDSNFNICNFSNGGDRVDIYAPGDTIFSTIPSNKYENLNWRGTSMASPHVSGVAAMIWSLNNELTGSQIKEIICKHSNMRCTSCKMVDAYMALEAAVRTNTDDTEKWAENGGILCWVVDVDDEDTKIENAVVTVTNISTGKTESTTTDVSGHFELILPEGEYTLTVQASGYDNYVWPDDNIGFSNPIVVKNNGVNYLDDWIKMKKTGTKLSGIPSDAVEYNGHYYYLYTGGIASSYDEALQYCKDKGGYLATLTSKEEKDFVYSYILQQDCDSAYFGLSDAANEGHWEWCTGEPLSYTNWHSGEPNGENSNEDYALFYYKFSDGSWNDGDFGGSTVNGGNAFICEWGDYATQQPQSPAGGAISDERNIVLTLDVSGSMSGVPIEETRKASAKFIDTALEEDASVGIVTYDTESEITSGFSNKNATLQSIVSNLNAGGGTNIEAGLRDAQWMLEKTDAKKKIIVLMSDGEPNHGLEGEDLIEYANEIKQSGTTIYTIGFFESLYEKSYAQYLMESIASDGCHYEVATADELVFFFEDMADQINGQKYIYVRIACPVDVSVSFDGETLSSSEKDLNVRTSFGTLTFEDNREEMDSGTDDRVKVLRLKDGIDYDLELTGTGHGIMNYTIGFMDENGDYSDLRRFENVKITRRTKIDTVASNSAESVLNIDEDGDGKYDLRLRAEANGYGEEVTTSNWIIYAIIGAAMFVLLDMVAIVFYARRKIKKGE